MYAEFNSSLIKLKFIVKINKPQKKALYLSENMIWCSFIYLELKLVPLFRHLDFLVCEYLHICFHYP